MNKPPIRLTFFGDSICVGQGVSIYHGWVAQIAKELDDLSQTIGREILVTNASVNGRTTRQALEDMPYHVQSAGVDIILVQFGLNDCNYWLTDKGLPRVSREAFVANLKEISDRARRVGAFRVLINSNHPTTRDQSVLPHTEITYENSNRDYSAAIRAFVVSQPSDVLFQDIEAHFAGLVAAGEPMSRYLLEDGLHLSRAGHAEYHKLVAPVVRKAVLDFANHA